jgi:hypothetical protein
MWQRYDKVIYTSMVLHTFTAWQTALLQVASCQTDFFLLRKASCWVCSIFSINISRHTCLSRDPDPSPRHFTNEQSRQLISHVFFYKQIFFRLKVPKHEISGPCLFPPSRPIWVSDVRTEINKLFSSI